MSGYIWNLVSNLEHVLQIEKTTLQVHDGSLGINTWHLRTFMMHNLINP